MLAILSKFTVLCLSFYFVVYFLKLKQFSFYNSHLLLYENIPNFASAPSTVNMKYEIINQISSCNFPDCNQQTIENSIFKNVSYYNKLQSVNICTISTSICISKNYKEEKKV